MRITRPAPRPQPETIIALIDVVFFLLVFFMLIGRMDATAPFDVSPPEARTGADMPAGGTTISVSTTGSLALDGVASDAEQIFAFLKKEIRETPDTLVRINAHKDVELRNVLPLITRLEQLGVRDQVLVVTPPPVTP